MYENEDPLPFALGGKEYYRHECDPGKRIFWVPPLENIVKVFGETFWIHADFQPDQVYVARITYNPAKRGQMKLFPLTPDMSEWSSIQEIARSKPSQPTRKIKGNQKEKMKKADGRRARYEERRRAEGKKVRGNYAQTILGKISKKEEKDPSLVRYLVPLGL
ncbi:MAG: hypothetical protein GY719_24660 [bacterium]|nr:hypothetical protein [bacterium]